MKKVFVAILLLAGVWWYASHRFNFSEVMLYAKKHSSESWAPALEYSVGMAYYGRGDYPKAEETFNQLLTDFATGEYQARGLLRLSEASEDNRDFQQARDAVDRYLEEYPDGPDRAIAETRKEHLYNK